MGLLRIQRKFWLEFSFACHKSLESSVTYFQHSMILSDHLHDQHDKILIYAFAQGTYVYVLVLLSASDHILFRFYHNLSRGLCFITTIPRLHLSTFSYGWIAPLNRSYQLFQSRIP